MLGILTYLPTLVFAPHSMYLLVIIYALIKQAVPVFDRDVKIYSGSRNINYNFMIISGIVILSLVNTALNFGKIDSLYKAFPFYILIPFTYLVAFTFQRRDFKILIFLFCIESLVVVAEYVMGVSTFFTSLQHYEEFSEGSLMYFSRPLGLSSNSSIAASKFVLGILICDYLNLKGWTWNIAKILLLGGIILTFNRTSLLVIFVYYAVRSTIFAFTFEVKKIRFLYALGAIIIISSFFIVIMSEYWLNVVMQLTRNKNEIELTGRELIWAHYFDFIMDNIWMGNGSIKYYLGNLHAHNSYIQTIATNGIIIAPVYFYLVLRNINTRNFVFVSMLALYSTFQYGIFWGISQMDIFLFVLLFRKSKNIEDYQREVKKESEHSLL